MPTATATPIDQAACAVQPGGTTTTCLVVDVDTALAGEQASRTLPPSGTFDVDIVARDVPAAGLGAFEVTLLYDASWLTASTPVSALGFDCSAVPASGRAATAAGSPARRPAGERRRCGSIQRDGGHW